MSAVKCFQAWLGLDGSGGGTALVSPGELYAGHRQLFDALLATLGVSDEALLEDLAETLGMFFGACAGWGGAFTRGTPASRLRPCVLRLQAS